MLKECCNIAPRMLQAPSKYAIGQLEDSLEFTNGRDILLELLVGAKIWYHVYLEPCLYCPHRQCHWGGSIIHHHSDHSQKNPQILWTLNHLLRIQISTKRRMSFSKNFANGRWVILQFNVPFIVSKTSSQVYFGC